MTAGEISQKEVEELVRSGVKIDIHLETLHEKLGENRKKRQGVIFRGAEFLWKMLTGKISSKKVRTDWETQIERFREIFGKNPDGINSHEHVHFFPPFFKIAMELQDKYAIPFIRFGDSTSLRHNNMISHVLHYLRKLNMPTCIAHGCVSSGSLVSLDWIKKLDDFLNNPPEGTIEIVCHPELAEDFVKIKKYF